MNKPQFTPGPWMALRQAFGRHVINSAKDGEYICGMSITQDNKKKRQAAANAAFIASAPEMYEVLSYVRVAIGDMLSPDGIYSTIYIHPEIRHRLHVMGLRVNEILEKARGEQ